MRLNGAEIFMVSDGLREAQHKRLADMDAFEVLCAANHCQRNGHADMAAALLKWQHAMNQTPRQRPPDAA